MHIYKIDSHNFGNFKSKLPQIMRKPNIMGVFSKGCGHCHAMEPAWNQLKSRLSGEKYNGGLVEIDSEVVPHIENQEIRKKINGYPTIMIIKNGRPTQEYTGNRSTEDMYNFCKQYLISNQNNSVDSSSRSSPRRLTKRSSRRRKMKGGSRKKRKNKKIKNY